MPGHDFAACHSSKADVSFFGLSLLNISVSPLPKCVLQKGKLDGPSLSVFFAFEPGHLVMAVSGPLD